MAVLDKCYKIAKTPSFDVMWCLITADREHSFPVLHFVDSGCKADSQSKGFILSFYFIIAN